MTPTEALDRAAWATALIWPSKHIGPGKFLERLPKDVQEALSRLTSEEASNVRLDSIPFPPRLT